MTAARIARRPDSVWRLRSTLSSAGFAVGNLGGLKTVRGRIPIREAWVAGPGRGRATVVGATLDLAALDTGHVRRDADLRKPRLLDAERYPTLTFDSSTVSEDGDHWSVTGTLTGCGHCTAITLLATATEHDDGTMHIHATTRFDRRDLGITAPRFLIGRDVQVTIDAVFAPPE